MGSSPSKNGATKAAVIGSDLPGVSVCEEDPEIVERQEREQRVRTKLRAYTNFMRGAPNLYNLFYQPSRRREELKDFLSVMRQKSELDWNAIQELRVRQEREEALEAGLPVERIAHHRSRRMSTLEFHGTESEVNCDLCGKVARCGSLPCRVCTKVFHRKCIEDSPYYRPEYDCYLDNALTETGWSCIYCNDITTLLSAREMSELMDDFDKVDINRDTTINREEFVCYKQFQYEELEGLTMPVPELRYAEAQFDLMDVDQTGTIDWYEFMHFESRKCFASKSEEKLIGMLTEKEKMKARWIYERCVYGGRHPGSHLRGVAVIPGSLVTWDEFLRDHALYIIWSRPNLQYEPRREPGDETAASNHQGASSASERASTTGSAI